MKPNKRQLRAIRTVIEKGTGRSSLFTWMVANHSALVSEYGTSRMPWKELCRIFAEFGLTAGNGNPPSENRAAKTWLDACKEVERRKALTNNVSQPKRSDRSNDWRPPVARHIPDPRNTNVHIHGPERIGGQLETKSALPPLPEPERKAGRPHVTYDDLSPEQKAMIDRVRAEFREADRKRAGNL